MNIESWPASRLPEALEALCKAAELPSRGALLAPAASDLARWIESAAACLGLEAEPVEMPYPDVPRMLRSCAPALVLLGDRAIAIAAGSGRTLRVLAPDLGLADVRLQDLSAVLRAAVEKDAGPEVDALLDRAAVCGRRRQRARAALLSARLGGARVGNCWLLRLLPGAGARRQMRSAGVAQRLALVAALYALQFVCWLSTWWLIGLAALQGRIEWGWLLAWGLLRLSIVPLRLAVSWIVGTLAIDAGALLKVRLLAGALRLLPEETRSEGVGRLLGRTIESEAVEQLGIGGAFLALFGAVELVFSAAMLALGAAGAPHAALLAAWCAIAALLAARYWRLRDAWTEARLSLTHDQVERIIGHKRGTGGTGGVSYLTKALELKFFPELWTIRTSM